MLKASYPDGYQPEKIVHENKEVDTPAVIDQILENPLDNLAEAIMHCDERDQAQLERLVISVLTSARLEHPGQAILKNQDLARVASYIGYYVIKCGVDYWANEYTELDVKMCQNMGMKQ